MDFAWEQGEEEIPGFPGHTITGDRKQDEDEQDKKEQDEKCSDTLTNEELLENYYSQFGGDDRDD